MDEEIIERVLLIHRLRMKLNPTPTYRELTGDRPTVMVDAAGHTCELRVRIYANGWDGITNESWSFKIGLDKPEAKSQLGECIAVLYHYLSAEEARA